MKGITPPKSMNPAMQRGVDQEDEAIEWLNMTTGKNFTPDCGTYADNERIIASLDGIDSDRKVIAEIKCSQKIYDAAKKGEIFPYYIAQCQHQMMVYGLDLNLFVAFDGFDGIIIEVKRDNDFIDKMLKAELEFLEFLDNDIEPPHSESDHVKIILDNDEVVNEYISLKNQITYLTKLEKQQKAIIEELGDSGNMELCSKSGKSLLKLTRVNKIGNVDWKSLCEAHGIKDSEIDTYRKPQIGYYKFTIAK